MSILSRINKLFSCASGSSKRASGSSKRLQREQAYMKKAETNIKKNILGETAPLVHTRKDSLPPVKSQGQVRRVSTSHHNKPPAPLAPPHINQEKPKKQQAPLAPFTTTYTYNQSQLAISRSLP